MNKTLGLVAFILFCVGLVLTIVGGLFLPQSGIVAGVLVLIGLVMGIIYVITLKDTAEINSLLLATLALLAMTAAFAPITFLDIGRVLTSLLVYFAALMAPIALITAIRVLLRVGFGPRVKI